MNHLKAEVESIEQDLHLIVMSRIDLKKEVGLILYERLVVDILGEMSDTLSHIRRFCRETLE